MRPALVIVSGMLILSLAGCSAQHLSGGGGSETTNASVTVRADQGVVSVRVNAMPQCTSNIFLTDSSYNPVTGNGFLATAEVIGSATLVYDSLKFTKANVMATDLFGENGCFISNIPLNPDSMFVAADTFRSTRTISGAIYGVNAGYDSVKIGFIGTHLHTVAPCAGSYSIEGVPLGIYRIFAVAMTTSKDIRGHPGTELQRDVSADSTGNPMTFDLYFSQ
jgi:hypothetical protein